MPPAPGQLRVGRYLLALAAILALLAVLAFWPGDRHTPKLGIDLVGGTQVTFTARAPHGETPTEAAMEQAKAIMEDRVNGSGVTNATVVVQGTNQIVISIPGGTDTDVKALGQPAQLNFRGLLVPVAQTTCFSQIPGKKPITWSTEHGGLFFAMPPSPTVTPDAVAQAFATAKHPLRGTPAAHKLGDGKTYLLARLGNGTTPYTSTDQTAITKALATALKIKQDAVQAAPLCATDPLFYLLDKDSKTYAPELAKLIEPCAGQTASALDTCEAKQPAGKSPVYKDGAITAAQQTALTSALATFDCAAAEGADDLPNRYYIACDKESPTAYLLGPVIVKGSQIDSADAQSPSAAAGTTKWSVALELGGGGSDNWADYTGDHNTNRSSPTEGLDKCGSSGTPCLDYVGFTLNGRVISAPYNSTTLGGKTEVTGDFTQKQAEDLADQLRYGALPLTFRVETFGPVSATLGTTQLNSSLLAGGIGLVLVVLYSLIYYRALGLVTIASLIVSGALTYGSLVFLGREIGFTLDLAGVAGFIIALGITADSFVVLFERLKDEVHEGRSVRVAVPRAWARARRTILNADAVSFLAAAVLYYFASAEVKGFAFTLGMSTLLDLVVVFLFTHPLLSLLSRSKAFGSARFTGLDSLRSGGVPATVVARRTSSGKVPLTKAAAGAERAERAPAAVAVLDKEDDDDGLVEGGDDGLVEGGQRGEGGAGRVEPDAPRERRRTTPAAGTAAERAAARRARLKNGGEK